MHFQFHQ